MSVEPWAPETFDERYRDDPDPWDFASSAYEQGRYDALLASLSQPTYGSAYEPGCSIGALTTRLAERCQQVLAKDVSPTAVERARIRCRHQPGVTIEVGSVALAPDRPFDLVVFSELGYYFEVEDLDRVIAGLAAAVAPGGELAACHWLGSSADHRLHGSVVHERLHQVLSSGFQHGSHQSHPGFVLDTWRRP